MARRSPLAPTTDRWIMVAIGVLPLAITLVSGLWTIGTWFGGLQTSVSKQITDQITPVAAKVNDVATKVDAASKEAQTSVDRVSAKVDAANNLIQAKQDSLNAKVDANVADQQRFRDSVQAGLTKLFDKQQALSDQINAETRDRLTSEAKKK